MDKTICQRRQHHCAAHGCKRECTGATGRGELVAGVVFFFVGQRKHTTVFHTGLVAVAVGHFVLAAGRSFLDVVEVALFHVVVGECPIVGIVQSDSLYRRTVCTVTALCILVQLDSNRGFLGCSCFVVLVRPELANDQLAALVGNIKIALLIENADHQVAVCQQRQRITIDIRCFTTQCLGVGLSIGFTFGGEDEVEGLTGLAVAIGSLFLYKLVKGIVLCFQILITDINSKLTGFVTCKVLLGGSFPAAGCRIEPMQAELCALQTIGLISTVYLVHNQLALRNMTAAIHILQGHTIFCFPFSTQNSMVIQLYTLVDTGTGLVSVLQHQCALVGNGKLHSVGVDAGCIHMTGITEGVFIAGQRITEGSICGIIQLDGIQIQLSSKALLNGKSIRQSYSVAVRNQVFCAGVDLNGVCSAANFVAVLVLQLLGILFQVFSLAL